MALMRSDDSVEIRHLSDFSVNGRCKNFISCIRKIPITFWIIGTASLLILLLIFMPQDAREILWHRIKSNVFLTVLITTFCVVSVSLVWKTGEKIDVWIFTVFNVWGDRPPWVDWTMLAMTQIGSGVFSFLVAVYFYLSGNRIFAYEIALGTLSLWLVVESLKFLIRRPRPYVSLKNIRIVGNRAGGHSFPSGHTSQAFFMASLFSHYFQLDLIDILILYILALAVGVTRMYVGMHYPRDVIGGSMLGTAWGLFGVMVNNYLFR